MIPEDERHTRPCSQAIKCFRSRGVGGQHTLCWCVLHRFLCSNLLITSIIGSIQQCQKVRGICNRVLKLFSTYGPGGVGTSVTPCYRLLALFNVTYKPGFSLSKKHFVENVFCKT